MPRWGQAIWPSLCRFSAVSPVTSAFSLAALDKGDPSVDYNHVHGEDEYSFESR